MRKPKLPVTGDEIPKHHKRAAKKKKKTFGIEYWSRWFKRWVSWKWYPTEQQRDQALADLITHTHTLLRGKRQFRKVDRQ